MTSRYLAGLLLTASLTLTMAPDVAAKARVRASAKAAQPALPPTSSTISETLAPGAARSLRFARPVTRIEVDKEGVIAVRAPNPRSIVLTGVAPGQATVSAYDAQGGLVSSGMVSVMMPNPAASALLARDSRMGGAAATRTGNGNAGGLALSGSVDSLEARADAQSMAGSTGEGPVVNYLRVNGEQMVAVDVQFVAVSDSTLKSLGFNFSKLNGDIQGAVVAPSALTSYAYSSSGQLSINASAPLQSAFNLFLGSGKLGVGGVMSALASTGLSQVLAQPTLLVRSGEEAHFLAGGEVPIPVPQSSGGSTNTIAIQFKEFGVRLSVAPTVLSDGRISLKIAPEVSELDYNNGVQLQGYTVPGIRRRSADTTVQLGNGQSFVIAGLSYTNNSTTKQKVPFLGDLPVLGAFFKNQSVDKERQELIIVATPRLVSPMKAETAAAMTASLTGQSPDLSFRDMILGSNDADKSAAAFGVVRR